jgi:hypothetical protein
VAKRQRAAAVQDAGAQFGGYRIFETALANRDLLCASLLLKIPRAQRRRHLEKSQFAAPVVSHRRAVRD